MDTFKWKSFVRVKEGQALLHRSNVMYHIHCSFDSNYISETAKNLLYDTTNTILAPRNIKTRALLTISENSDHKIEFAKLKILGTTRKQTKLFISELCAWLTETGHKYWSVIDSFVFVQHGVLLFPFWSYSTITVTVLLFSLQIQLFLKLRKVTTQLKSISHKCIIFKTNLAFLIYRFSINTTYYNLRNNNAVFLHSTVIRQKMLFVPHFSLKINCTISQILVLELAIFIKKRLFTKILSSCLLILTQIFF